MYFAKRSVLEREPVLICPVFKATAKSAIVTSSVSPDLCDITDLYLFLLPKLTASIVSVNVPIWLNLIKIAFAVLLSIPFCNFSTLVTNKSSPTNWHLSPNLSVNIFQPSQSFSSIPSSIEIIGYFSTQPAQKSTICAEVNFSPVDHFKWYTFSSLL